MTRIHNDAFGGQIVAVRDSVGVTYLHGDDLGSISVATTSTGAVASRQQFDPWGKVRSGGVSQTSVNYTGQRLDDTGLLFYNARYYNPALGRFISADSVVPGNASGGMDGIALRPLTVDFHEPGFVTTLNSEGANADKLYWGGPVNPQSLNRYSYVGNNPMGATDPTGHNAYLTNKQARDLVDSLNQFAQGVVLSSTTAGSGGALLEKIVKNAALSEKTLDATSRVFFRAIIAGGRTIELVVDCAVYETVFC